MKSLFLKSDATFSDCGRYRYSLSRRWDEGDLLVWIMLNPSTADAENDDPTIRRCQGFARQWGFAGVQIFNLFALRSTDPLQLYTAEEPVGEHNDHYLLAGARGCVVAAWGCHGKLRKRDLAVQFLLRKKDLYCLGVTKEGQPKHPLYVRGDVERTLYLPAVCR